MISRRNFRYRHPISAQAINDYFTEIYEMIVYLLGIQNNKATKYGIIRQRITGAPPLSSNEIDANSFDNATYTLRKYRRE